MYPQHVPRGTEHTWVWNTHTLSGAPAVQGFGVFSVLNCVVRLAKRLQHKASCPPWTLTLRGMYKVVTVLNQFFCQLQERHFNSTGFVPSQTLKGQKSPYLPSPGAGSNTGAGLVTTAGYLALVSEDLYSPEKT